MRLTIACVVEGHGEVHALPVLLRRIAGEIQPEIELDVPHPLRFPRSKLISPGGLEKAIGLAALKCTAGGGVVVVLDSDDDCPAVLAPTLVGRIRGTRPDLPFALVLAQREFEAWFLAGAESLRGHRGSAGIRRSIRFASGAERHLV